MGAPSASAATQIGTKENPLLHEFVVERDAMESRVEAEGVAPVTGDVVETCALAVKAGYRKEVFLKAIKQANAGSI